MGGSGGGRSVSDHIRDVLSAKASDALAAAASGKRNVFISFASEDLRDVWMLRGQAKNSVSDLEFSDRSVKEAIPSKRDEVIERTIREKIRQASVTVCYVSEHTAQSDWVDWEIRETIAQGKGVVCMYKGDRPPSRLPAAIKEHRIQMVKWSHQELMKAIANAATKGAPSERR